MATKHRSGPSAVGECFATYSEVSTRGADDCIARTMRSRTARGRRRTPHYRFHRASRYCFRVNAIVGSFKPERSRRPRSGSKARSCLLRFSKHFGEKRRLQDDFRRRHIWRDGTTSSSTGGRLRRRERLAPDPTTSWSVARSSLSRWVRRPGPCPNPDERALCDTVFTYGRLHRRSEPRPAARRAQAGRLPTRIPRCRLRVAEPSPRARRLPSIPRRWRHARGLAPGPPRPRP